MFDDKESDFWKSKINELQHSNMTRPGAERLNFEQVPEKIKDFESAHPNLGAKATDNGTYITWEIPVTSTVKLRVFFQSQIKLSLMETTSGDAVKICDAKCFYNPFPEIENFVSKISEFKKELEELLKTSLQLSKKQKVAGEFIKAYLQTKIPSDKFMWQITAGNDCFHLVVTDLKTSEQKEINLTCENFKSEICGLPKLFSESIL